MSCQISDVLCDAGKPCGVASVCLYGGTSKGPQISSLKSGVVSCSVIFFPYCVHQVLMVQVEFFLVLSYNFTSNSFQIGDQNVIVLSPIELFYSRHAEWLA